jgi:MYXO-CTERM domain-containing protein
LEYALRNTTWDYEFESDYEMSVADYNGDGESHRSSGTIFGLLDDWYGPGDWESHTFGSNSWALEDLPDEIRVEFDGDTGITWRVGIAQQDGTEHRRWIMPADADGWELTDFDGGDEAWLVIVAVDDNSDDGETHGYQFKITDLVEEQKGGCSTTSNQTLGWFGLMLLALGIRRR